MTKWLYLPTFSLVLLGQFILAIGQALVLTSITEIVSRWFPIRERGMAVGITSASQYLSLAVVMILSPILVVTKANDPSWGSGFEELMRFYAILSSTLALVAAILIRENPPSPSSALPTNNKVHYKSSFRAINAIPSLRGLMIIFAIGWGVLMTLFIKIDEISECLALQIQMDSSELPCSQEVWWEQSYCQPFPTVFGGENSSMSSVMSARFQVSYFWYFASNLVQYS
jgi:MFS family permease